MKASRIRAGDFPETRAPPVAPVSRRELANSIHSFMFILLVLTTLELKYRREICLQARELGCGVEQQK